jgi:hypothetical protein
MNMSAGMKKYPLRKPLTPLAPEKQADWLNEWWMENNQPTGEIKK